MLYVSYCCAESQQEYGAGRLQTSPVCAEVSCTKQLECELHCREMAEKNLVRHPQGHSLGKSIMLLFLGHQHPIRRKPSDVKGWCFPLGKGISAQYSLPASSFSKQTQRPPCPVLTALSLALNWTEEDDLSSL